MRSAFITALIWSGLTFGCFVLGRTLNWNVLLVLPFWVLLLLCFPVLIWFERKYSKSFSFNDILKIGLRVSVIAGVVFSIVMFVYLKADSSFYSYIVEQSYSYAGGKIPQKVPEISFVGFAPVLIMKFLAVGFIYTLLLAYIFKKN